jgi:hypothetical protein
MKDEQDERRKSPLQFGIRSVLAMAVATAVLFGLLRWFETPVEAQYIVLAVLGVSIVCAVGLLLVIASSVTGDEDDRE